ncbi:hypothetical protein BDD26_3882 [Xenorhabdus cabanillasii]|uniref:Uncharacterized protein n=1 Tax=Xenorhabdus cabanillasii TaxID=351673 RepID=A0A3D9UKG0_9GAMM|nr:hypothetical protein BDD26_3882 [Xenorhabdus cabanillasii]
MLINYNALKLFSNKDIIQQEISYYGDTFVDTLLESGHYSV